MTWNSCAVKRCLLLGHSLLPPKATTLWYLEIEPLSRPQSPLIRTAGHAATSRVPFRDWTIRSFTPARRHYSPYHLIHLEDSRKPSEMFPSRIYLREGEMWSILWKLTLLCAMIIPEINDTFKVYRLVEIFADICKYYRLFLLYVGLWKCNSQVQPQQNVYWRLARDHFRSFTC